MIKVICQGWSAPTIGQTRGPPLPRAPITSPPKISDRPPPMNGTISTMLRASGRCLREKDAAARATAEGNRTAADAPPPTPPRQQHQQIISKQGAGRGRQ